MSFFCFWLVFLWLLLGGELMGAAFLYIRLQIIDRHVPRGSHYVECQLLGEEDDRNVPAFKIIGIFAT